MLCCSGVDDGRRNSEIRVRIIGLGGLLDASLCFGKLRTSVDVVAVLFAKVALYVGQVAQSGLLGLRLVGLLVRRRGVPCLTRRSLV